MKYLNKNWCAHCDKKFLEGQKTISLLLGEAKYGKILEDIWIYGGFNNRVNYHLECFVTIAGEDFRPDFEF